MKKVFCFILCYILCLCILYGSLRMANAETIVPRQQDIIIDGEKYTISNIFCIQSVDIYTKIWIQNKDNEHIKNCRHSKGPYCIHSQDIVDVNHLALAQTTYDGNIHICDHVNQDFENLKYVKPGDIAYVEINGVKTYYICVENGLGKSYEDSGKTYKGWNIWYGAYKPNGHVYPLVCSTCTNLDGIITVVVFDYYEEEN